MRSLHVHVNMLAVTHPMIIYAVLHNNNNYCLCTYNINVDGLVFTLQPPSGFRVKHDLSFQFRTYIAQ